jgi:hypothetical protein
MASVDGGGGGGSAIGAGTSLLGAGITAFADIYGGKSQSKMLQYQAQVARQIAFAKTQSANVTEYAGGRAAESEGLKYGGLIARGAVGYGAGNVAGRSVSDVRASQTAVGVQAQRETFAKYAEAAYQERFTGAEEIAKAGEEDVAAKQAKLGGYISAAGAIVGGTGKAIGQYTQASVVGDSQPVSSKWYDT